MYDDRCELAKSGLDQASIFCYSDFAAYSLSHSYTYTHTHRTIRVPGVRGGSYGLNFRSSCPVMLADVDPGSPADKAGLMKGDFLVQLNGNDIQRSSEEAVRTIIKYSQGSKLTVRIARPHPFPSTDYLRRRAIITLQTQVREMHHLKCFLHDQQVW